MSMARAPSRTVAGPPGAGWPSRSGAPPTRAIQRAEASARSGVERLSDGRAEVERAVEDDVGDREAVADDERAARDQPVEPGELVARRRLQAVGGLGQHAHARPEELDALGVAEAVVEVLGDVELDAARPHARLGPLLGRRADERRLRVLLLEVLEDGDRLAEHAAVVELERGQLAAGVLLRVRRARFSAPSRSTASVGS